MIALCGNIFLWMALVLGLLQTSRCADRHRRLVACGFALAILLAFAALLYGHITSDFSLLNVFQNSHTAKPLLYKVVGAWGSHEGSMLLLLLMLALYHAAYSLTSPDASMTLQLHALIMLGFLGFVMLTSSPFTTLTPIPSEGMDLNPLLQDIGLAIHPPLLYTGYMGFSIVFALTLTHLVQGTLTTAWVSEAKRWLCISWIFLTIGIAAGSWWAYRELGWGGYWFWDPVENTSLMPWLAGTALLHSALALEKRRLFPNWVALLAILTFILSLIGVFLVRSGLLTSVHSFAQDPGRGLYILGLLSLVSVGSLLVIIRHPITAAPPAPYRFCSKETGLLLNNLLIITFCFTVLFGTLYPLILEYCCQQFVSVSAPYFNTLLRWVAAPLLLLAAFAPALAWQSDTPKRLIRPYLPALVLTLDAAYLTGAGYVFPFLGWWVILLSAQRFLFSKKRSLRQCGMTLAHIGLGCLVISLAVVSHGQSEKQALLKQNETLTLGTYTLTLKEMFLFAQDNYLLREGVLEISQGEKILGTLRPQVRYYPVRAQNTTESAIYRHGLSDIYVVLGDTNGKDAFAVRAYERPLVNGIWLSAALMAMGVLLVLLGKKKEASL